MLVLFLLTGRPFSLKEKSKAKEKQNRGWRCPLLICYIESPHWSRWLAPSLPCLSIWTQTAQAGPLLLASQISPTWHSWQCSQSFTPSSLSMLGYRSLFYLFDKSSSLTALHTAMLVSLGVSSLAPCSNHLWLYLTHFTYQTMSHPSFQSSESDIMSTFPWIFQNLLSL